MNFLLFEVRNMTARCIDKNIVLLINETVQNLWKFKPTNINETTKYIIQKFWVHEFELNHCILTTWTWLPVYIIVTAKNTLKSSSLSAQFGFLRMAAQIP